MMKWRRGVDIRSIGSGNVGAMNSLDAGGTVGMAATIFFIDVFKGLLAAGLGWYLFRNDFPAIGCTAIGAIAGHNFPVWLKGKGGKGLASATGICLVIGWGMLATWGLLWAGSYGLTKDINVSNVIALAITPLVLVLSTFVPGGVLHMILPLDSGPAFHLAAAVMCALILVRHASTIRSMWGATDNRSARTTKQ
jgi:glycerol-3-phosphate acyltransferase PlsY